MADLIDREALLDGLEELFRRRELNAAYTGNRGCAVTWNDAICAIKDAPTAQPERMRGHWIEIQAPDSDGGNGLYECSICHRGEVHVPIVEVPYCWHCGADMRGGQDG